MAALKGGRMKDALLRLMICLLDRPDSLGSAFDRSVLREESFWDKLRLMMAALIKKWG